MLLAYWAISFLIDFSTAGGIRPETLVMISWSSSRGREGSLRVFIRRSTHSFSYNTHTHKQIIMSIHTKPTLWYLMKYRLFSPAEKKYMAWQWYVSLSSNNETYSHYYYEQFLNNITSVYYIFFSTYLMVFYHQYQQSLVHLSFQYLFIAVNIFNEWKYSTYLSTFGTKTLNHAAFKAMVLNQGPGPQQNSNQNNLL